MSGPVSVAELQRAWRSVAAGEFRTSDRASSVAAAAAAEAEAGSGWQAAAGERVVPVVAASGSVGATTVALAAATAASESARLIECAAAGLSGLAGAGTAELGVEGGWRQGRRGPVLLQRPAERVAGSGDLPSPPPAAQQPGQLTLLDLPVEDLTRAVTGWVGPAVARAEALVVVAAGTVPGLRRLEAALSLLQQLRERRLEERVVLAVVGWPRRGGAVPKQVIATAGPLSQALLSGLVVVPHERRLALWGVDSQPLPAGVVRAGGRVLARAVPGGADGAGVEALMDGTSGEPSPPGSEDEETEEDV